MKSNDLYGKPVPGSGAPSHEEALSLLLRVERLIASNKKKDREAALGLLKEANGYKVYSVNILNASAGLIEIEARSKGSCCDPAMESYHCM